jgi:hypothetical protein
MKVKVMVKLLPVETFKIYNMRNNGQFIYFYKTWLNYRFIKIIKLVNGGFTVMRGEMSSNGTSGSLIMIRKK